MHDYSNFTWFSLVTPSLPDPAFLLYNWKQFFCSTYIDFSPFIQVEAVVNFYQIGFLPHKESPPGTFQPLSPSRGLATQLQHILSGLEFRLFQYFHFSCWKVWNWKILLSVSVVLILCWKQQEDKVIGESFLTSRDLPTQNPLFAPTQILAEPTQEINTNINRDRTQNQDKYKQK